MLLLYVVGIALATLPFVLVPLWRSRPLADPEARATTAPAATRLATLQALYRGRREELAREADEGILSAADLEQALTELDRNALRDLEQAAAAEAAATAAAADSAERGRVWLYGFAALAVAGVLGGYLALGELEAPQLAGAEAVLALAETETTQLDDWRIRLEGRVLDRPADAKSHYLLGHIALKQRRFDAAADAFAAANLANGQPDPGIDIYWLQARFLAADARLDETSQEIVRRLLEQAPNQPAVLEILAIDALRSGRFSDAVTVLNRALAQPLGPEQRQALEAGLAQARGQLAIAPGVATGGPAVDVSLGLGDHRPPAGATLFVIARPAGGGMPFAVVRRPGPDYPQQVRLDDLVSMNPARPLSSAGTVEIVVRLSRSGQPMAQPGDWEWRSPVLDLAATEDWPIAVEAQLAPPTS
ncbi:MAG: c-type cytochrome biogenesis protein CcmI [Pseudomonadota bacterium]